MDMMELGRGETVMLLHGGGLAPWSCRALAERLAARYHVLVPVLDGHAGSGCAFTSIEENAARLLRCIDEHSSGRLLTLCGLSLGGQIAAEMLAQRPDLCSFALLESVSVLPSPLLAALIPPSIALSGGLIRKEWFSRLQFRYLRLPGALYPNYYRDSCAIRQTDMAAFLRASTLYEGKSSLADVQAQVLIVAGGREEGRIIRSASRLREMLPGGRMRLVPGMHHGELSIKYPEKYMELLSGLMEDRL